MKPTTKIRIAALLLGAALLFPPSAAPLHVYASPDEESGYSGGDTADDEPQPSAAANAAVNQTIQNLENKIASRNSELESIQSKQKEIESQINSAKTEKEKELQVASNYSHQVALTQDEIIGLAERIELMEELIDLKQKEIWFKQDEIDVKYDQFKQRIRARYMQDDGTALGLLLGADSFSEFLTTTEYTARIAEHDRTLMQELTAERESLELAQQDLADDKSQLEDDKARTEGKKQELSRQYAQAIERASDIELQEQAFKANLEENIAMQKRMQAEIDQLFKDLEFNKNPYVGGEMMWPLPGFYQISSHYGTRFGGSDFHTGTDMYGSGCMGADVVAANDGQVAFVNTQYTPGYSYGIYILIDHGVNDQGQSVSTLYAHLDSASVSVGQTVQKGQRIGACGSTGWSTGPHLHFEVRLNGQYVNSLPYVQAS